MLPVSAMIALLMLLLLLAFSRYAMPRCHMKVCQPLLMPADTLPLRRRFSLRRCQRQVCWLLLLPLIDGCRRGDGFRLRRRCCLLRHAADAVSRHVRPMATAYYMLSPAMPFTPLFRYGALIFMMARVIRLVTPSYADDGNTLMPERCYAIERCC